MKKSFIPIILFLFAIIACQKKGLPVITERKQATPVVLPVIENIAPDTSAGKTIFLSRCARCHDLPVPDQYTASRWEGILSSMMSKARLDREQQIHITAYLKAHAAQ